MEALTQFIAPIVSLWVIHNAILSSAKFVNRMRETVISGLYEGVGITVAHQRALRLDWLLCIGATVGVCIIFAGIVVAVALTFNAGSLMRWAGFAIALYPALCAVGFLICSVGRLPADGERHRGAGGVAARERERRPLNLWFAHGR